MSIKIGLRPTQVDTKGANMYNSYWESVEECRRDAAKRLRAAHANRENGCGEIDADEVLMLLGCIPLNVCLGYDAEKPFWYSTEELLYLAELLDSANREGRK